MNPSGLCGPGDLFASTLAGAANREPNRSRLSEPEPLLLYPLTHERINSAAVLMAL